jgi:antitoxin ParD1/3/4
MPTSIALTPHFESLTKQLVDEGRYNNVSEVVRAGLRLLEFHMQQDAAKLVALREAVHLGFNAIDQGDSLSFSSDQAIEHFIQQAGKAAKAAVSRSKKVD